MDPKQENKEVRDEDSKPNKGGRGRNGGRKPSDAFRGKCPELQGWIYDYDSAARPDQYERTTEALVEWAKQNLGQFAHDVWKSMVDLVEPSTDEWLPEEPTTDSLVLKKVFDEKVKRYVQREELYEHHRQKVFSVTLGQCAEVLKAKLEGQHDWGEIVDKHSVVQLLKSVKAWMLNQQDTKNPMVAIDVTMQALFKLRQNRYESLVVYRKRFAAVIDVLKHSKIDLGKALTKAVDASLKAKGLVRSVPAAAGTSVASSVQVTTAEEEALQKFYAVRFLSSVDRVRYGNISTDLENSFIKGSNQYPKNLTAAYNMLANWKVSGQQQEARNGDGLNFAQSGEQTEPSGRRGRGGRGRSRGGRRPHWANQDAETLNCMVEDGEGHAEDNSGEQNNDEVTDAIQAEAQDDEDDDAYRVTMCSTHQEGDGEPNPMSADAQYTGGAFFCMASEEEAVANLAHKGQGLADTVMSHSFNKGRAYVIPDGSIGLDSMSSVDVFGDARMLEDIRPAESHMRIVCNAGAVVVTQVGELKGYGTVWYHPDAIANILSLGRVQRRFKVKYDSAHGDFFSVERDDGRIRLFTPTSKGLYASQVLNTQGEQECTLVATVADNVKSFTKREVKRATAARRLMEVVGRPSEEQMRQIISCGQLRNCATTEQDLRNARDIFGPDIGSLRGKTTRRKEAHVELTAALIAPGTLERHREVVVCFDLMYVNQIAFAVSISRALKFVTAEALDNRRASTLLACLISIKKIYSTRGFLVTQVAADNEFETLRTPLAGEGMMLNVVARGEHVPEVERHIRTLKERCRAVYNSLPYRRMPKRMVIELVYAMTFWLHAFPARDGVSATVSPRELVTGLVLDANKHCRIPFGAYAQTHEEHDNTMGSRTVGAIALRPTGNAQGGHLFFSLQTGRCINRNHWTEVPMPSDAISRVEQMADSKGLNALVFGDRANQPEPDDDVAEVQSISSSSSDDEVDGSGAASDGDDDDHYGDDGGRHEPDDAEVAQDVNSRVTQDEAHEPYADDHGAEQFTNEHAPLPLPRMPEQKRVGPKPEPTIIAPREASEDESEWADAVGGAEENTEVSADGQPASTGASEEAENTGVLPAGASSAKDAEQAGEADDRSAAAAEVSMSENARSGQRRLRPPRKLKKPTRYRDGAELSNDDEAACAHGTVPLAPKFGPSQLSGFADGITPLTTVLLTQYGMNKGLRAFGKPADDAIRTEMVQLHELNVMKPRAPATITRSEKRSALQYLMFLKQKRSGAIKGRGCADGRKQRGEMTKPEASSPTVSTEAVFLLLTIAAKEGREVMVIDIPGAFLQTDLDPSEQVLIRLDGRMAELLALIDPQIYRPNIVTEGGKPVIYAQLKKALYGMIQSALRFWEQVLTDITKLGFEVNPYDWCVANRTVNGSQQTICWHVDDFLISHIDNAVNEELASWFSEKYGKRLPLSVHRGKKHDYLGMEIDLTGKGKVQITMYDFTSKLLAEVPEEFTGTAATPAANHLFETNPEQVKLSERDAGIFHHLVAKMLYLSKRARPDIQLAVAFLCTRVSAPDVDDWKKLARTIAYLRGSAELPLTLEANDGRIVKWWVDAAFAVTHNMRSQSGGTMTLGRGSVTSSSTRQRINTRSSTEAELVAANDFLPQVLWTRYFLNEQGYGVKENILHQDNQSAMMLEHNGRASSGKRTRHINIRYYFISDRIAAGEVAVKYCPTAEMLGDFFTKPLQGASFRKFRKEILNLGDGY